MSYFKEKIISFFLKDYTVINSYFPISKLDVFDYFKKRLLLRQYKTNDSFCVNFIITSKAEIRVFTPLLNYIVEYNPEIKVKLFFAKKGVGFDSNLLQKIYDSKTIKIEHSALSLTEYENAINVICLDHNYYKNAHKIGVDIVTFLNSKKQATVCVQHGGNQKDYINGHLSSISKYQLLFGRLIYNRFVEFGFSAKNLFLTGNPLHDKAFRKNLKLIFDAKRKVISLITCVHTEYDDRSNPRESYIQYVKTVFESINYEEYVLVIKMHPYDPVEDNIYDFVRMELGLTESDIRIIGANDTSKTVYDVIKASSLVISRASSVIEESLMLKKRVVAFDLYEDGASKHYDFLLKYDIYKKVIKDSKRLALAIRELESSIISDFEIDEIIGNTTYKLDGKSTERIMMALKSISIFNK
ncbi:hypothetical protein ABI125_07685 [Tamlana crocina]